MATMQISTAFSPAMILLGRRRSESLVSELLKQRSSKSQGSSTIRTGRPHASGPLIAVLLLCLSVCGCFTTSTRLPAESRALSSGSELASENVDAEEREEAPRSRTLQEIGTVRTVWYDEEDRLLVGGDEGIALIDGETLEIARIHGVRQIRGGHGRVLALSTPARVWELEGSRWEPVNQYGAAPAMGVGVLLLVNDTGFIVVGRAGAVLLANDLSSARPVREWWAQEDASKCPDQQGGSAYFFAVSNAAILVRCDNGSGYVQQNDTVIRLPMWPELLHAAAWTASEELIGAAEGGIWRWERTTGSWEQCSREFAWDVAVSQAGQLALVINGGLVRRERCAPER